MRQEAALAQQSLLSRELTASAKDERAVWRVLSLILYCCVFFVSVRLCLWIVRHLRAAAARARALTYALA